MKRVISLILCLLTAASFYAVPAANAAESKGKIYPFVPAVEEYYPGVEDYIASALREKKSNINIAQFGVSTDNIIYVFKSTIFDNPDIFYVEASYINYKFNNQTGLVEYIQPTYIVSKSKIPAMIKKFNSAAKTFISGIGSNWTDFQKALTLHDRIAVSCKYKEQNALSFTAYSALVTGKSICEGYSRAYSYLLSLVGVDSKIINNDKHHHCWNCVKVGGRWYHIDVTSDDPTPDTDGYVRHSFFLCTNNRLLSESQGEHKDFDEDVTYTDDYSCSSSKYNSSFTRSITSQIVYKNNAYYFINNKYKGKYQSAFIRRKNGSNKVLKLITERWYYKHRYPYNGSYSKLCIRGKYIYLNTRRSLYRYNLNTKKFKRLHTLASFKSRDFYGLSINGNKIYATRYNSVMKSKQSTEVIRFISGKAVVKPYVQYSSIKLKKGTKFKFQVYGGSGKTKYTASNKKATVSKMGRIKAKKKGSCTITAVRNGFKFKLKVKITK